MSDTSSYPWLRTSANEVHSGCSVHCTLCNLMSVSCQLFQSGRIAENFNENLCVRVVSDYNSVQGDGVRLETGRLADTSSII